MKIIIEEEKIIKIPFIDVCNSESLLGIATGNENVDTILKYISSDLYTMYLSKHVFIEILKNVSIKFDKKLIIVRYDNSNIINGCYDTFKKYVSSITDTENPIDKLVSLCAYREYKYIIKPLISAFAESNGEIPEIITMFYTLKSIIEIYDDYYKVLDWNDLVKEYVQCIVDDVRFISNYDISEHFPGIERLINE